MRTKKINFYLVNVLLTMLALPAVSILVNHHFDHDPLGWPLIGKWLVFWAIGVRLSIAGLRQAISPSFTAQQIFHIPGTDSFPVIRELGFANISLGLVAMLSIFWPSWRIPLVVGGGLYFGLAGMLHVFKRPDSGNELIALISDLFIFVMMLLYLYFTYNF